MRTSWLTAYGWKDKHDNGNYRRVPSGSWDQLPQESWHSIHNKFLRSSPKFGYSIGDKVGWQSSDKGVPPGSQGRIAGFEDDAVEVKLAFGEFLFHLGVLYRIGEDALFFKLGDAMTWTWEDSDVLHGCVGVVLVDSGTRECPLESALCLATHTG